MEKSTDQLPCYIQDETYVNDNQETLEKSIMNGLQELYFSKMLCDATIVVEDKSFSCHRVVLSSVSPYFRSMFSSCLKESIDGEVVISEVSPSVMQAVLHFIYTGEASLNLENIEELFTVSSRLQIIPLQDLCSRYLVRNLSRENCLWIYRVAYSHNNKILIEAAIDVISWHFTTLSKEEDFLHLDLGELQNILSSHKLMVSSELSVYHLACRWWEFNNKSHPSLPEELLKLIRFPLMSTEELEEVKEDVTSHISCRLQLKNLKLREGMFEDRIVCMDLQERENFELTDCDFHLDAFEPTSGEWTKLPSLKSLMCPGCLAVKNYLFVAGGIHQDDSISNTLHVYDSVWGTWTQLAPMVGTRSMHGFLAYNQKLYAVGGWDGSVIIESAECYNVLENCWHSISTMPLPLRMFASAQLNGKLYLIGGETNPARSNSMYQGFLIYNIITDVWSQFVFRRVIQSAGAVILDNKIFVIGGYTNKISDSNQTLPNIIATSKCFCMGNMGQIFHNCPVPPLPEKIASSGVVVWKRRIYVLGGEDEERFSDRIYSWTPGESKWTRCKERLPVPYGGVSDFGCATMKVPLKHIQSLITARNDHSKVDQSNGKTT